MATTVSNVNSERSPKRIQTRQQVLGVRITGSGTYLPENIVTNADLANLGCDEEWIFQRTGITERRHAPAHMATSDLAFEAASSCIENAGLSPSDIDLVIMGTMTPDHSAPNCACILQDRLGTRGGAMDINTACSGFIYSFVTASQFIKSGCYQNILVVGADVMSRIIDPNDVKTYPLFGDGAGAVIVSKSGSNDSPTQGIQSFQLGADGGKGHHLLIPVSGSREAPTPDSIAAGRHFLAMDGRPVFKWAVRKVADSIRYVLDQSGKGLEELAKLFIHQANIRIIDAALTELGISSELVPINLNKCGNTTAASIPLVIDEASRSGDLKRGDLVAMCGFGAGLTWGTCIVEW